ncbi:hypothetical protein PSTG_15107 [Puccinia striiformis f. sp. tritici PST-78]|uniref:OTU domain-containing protein n=1 Tax=Puccinia striiformis f. sp. tritici PST-78 TaxID=1165861 RepID=A0A0L0UX35_9BASI|nr:hypothetical protein PSTG_15107 [Puccinia striiformis f. sp. tritici PST-78]
MESAHAFVKSHLLGPQHSFASVVKLISNALEAQYHEISAHFHQQKMVKLQYLGKTFRECSGVITNYALQKAYNNLAKAKKLPKNHRCNGDYRVRMGIPCKHQMAELLESGELLSPDEFHAQWHIKSIRPLTKVTNEGLLEKVEEIKTKLLSMNAAQAAIHLAQINDIFEGTGTVIDIKLPTEAQKTRGRPGGSKNKPKTTKRDESEFEHLSVSKAFNVKADGHCGYWAVSWALGRGQGDYMKIREELVKEVMDRREWYSKHSFFATIDSILNRLTVNSPKPCHVGKWMSMPTMGDIIANAYQRSVFFFSAIWSQTFFPHSCLPNNNPPIFLALVSKHFIPLSLNTPSLFPAPQLLTKDWTPKASPEALKWQPQYEECFKLTISRKLLFPSSQY